MFKRHNTFQVYKIDQSIWKCKRMYETNLRIQLTDWWIIKDTFYLARVEQTSFFFVKRSSGVLVFLSLTRQGLTNEHRFIANVS